VHFGPVRNPTHATATVSLVLRAPVRDATVEIYDLGGRRVSELHRGALPAGARSLAWDGRSREGRLAHTGVYFVRARLDGFEQVTRFVLLP
jgi:flagellar hook assembly protein FlgD